jgi:hypothetical protein
VLLCSKCGGGGDGACDCAPAISILSSRSRTVFLQCGLGAITLCDASSSRPHTALDSRTLESTESTWKLISRQFEKSYHPNRLQNDSQDRANAYKKFSFLAVFWFEIGQKRWGGSEGGRGAPAAAASLMLGVHGGHYAVDERVAEQAGGAQGAGILCIGMLEAFPKGRVVGPSMRLLGIGAMEGSIRRLTCAPPAENARDRPHPGRPVRQPDRCQVLGGYLRRAR